VIYRGEQVLPNESRTFTVSSPSGCDSTIIINVALMESNNLLLDNQITSCDPIILNLDLDSIRINDIPNEAPVSISESGFYVIEGIDINGCIQKDSVTVLIGSANMYLPNILQFDDDINGCFKPYFNGDESVDYEIQVFDRWGELVFKNSEANNCWRGFFNGTKVELGIYTYLIKIDSECIEEETAGMVMVIK